MEHYFGQKSRFIFIMTTRFIMIDQDVHDDKLWFYDEPLRFSWWQVKILMMTDWNFLDAGRNSNDGRSRFFQLWS